MTRSAGWAALAAVALAGCAVGPRYRPPTADAPPTWRALATAPGAGVSADPIEDAAWWKSFGDPELSALEQRALAANLQAKQAVLRIEEARAERRIAAAGGWPAVDATAAAEDTRISERTATTSVFTALTGEKTALPPGISAAIPALPNPFSQYQYGLTGSWEVDLFGRVRRGVEAADAETAAAVADRDAVRVSLMAEVAAAYIDLRGAEARRQVSVEAVATSTQLLKLAADARAADLDNDFDVASARAALASAEAALPPLETEIAADKSQLELLLAAKPGALEAELAADAAIPPAPARTPIGAPAALARRRPDIRAAEAALHGAVARQGVAVASLYPDLTLSLAGGLEASTLPGLADWAARYFAGGPALDLPVFDAGRRQASVRIADAQAKEAALAYAQTVLTALHEVDDAIAAYGEEQSRRGALRQAAAESRAALDLAEARYRTGSVSFRDVLDAEAKLQAAELALAASQTAASEDLVTLYRSLGGGWEAS